MKGFSTACGVELGAKTTGFEPTVVRHLDPRIVMPIGAEYLANDDKDTTLSVRAKLNDPPRSWLS